MDNPRELEDRLIDFAVLQIIERKELCDPKKLAEIVDECDQLIAIFVKSVKTAETRMS